jgi:hypothetical protein
MIFLQLWGALCRKPEVESAGNRDRRGLARPVHIPGDSPFEERPRLRATRLMDGAPEMVDFAHTLVPSS